jgi:hypothetical protein
VTAECAAVGGCLTGAGWHGGCGGASGAPPADESGIQKERVVCSVCVHSR